MKYIYIAFIASMPLILLSCSCQSKNTQTKQQKPLTGDALLTLVQKNTFNYFWDGAEPVSGMARERYNVDGNYPLNDKNIVTSGGGGFGIMAILVGIERGFITRQQGAERLEKIVGFLEKADRFHGAWPHWWYGETGKVKPFSKNDDGGDLVESSFLIQGLLSVHQYFKDGDTSEKALAQRIDKLWKEVDWKWYTNGKNILYWHWSPNSGWKMNFPVKGYNECLIMYILAAASPTYGVSAEVYHQGWAQNGKINKEVKAYGHTLSLLHQGGPLNGGPLFWAHYSYLGLDPRGLKDRYASDYFEENKNQTLINRDYCVTNPNHYTGYGDSCWGLTSSYSVKGYAGHAPQTDRDHGVIAPTAALSSIVYTPQSSIAVMSNLYNNLGDKVWGQYGFYDAFSQTANWYPKQYLAIDQGPIVVMIENYRSQLLWKLFMSHPDVQAGLKKLDFTSPYMK